MSKIKTNKWKFIGGRLCLDFVNTVGGRKKHEEKSFPENIVINDKLQNFNDLVAWGKDSGIFSEAEEKYFLNMYEKNEQEKFFKKAIELRESLFKIIYNLINKKEPEEVTIQILNSKYAAANANRKLVYADNKIGKQFSKDPLKLDYLLWLISESAVDLLSSDYLFRVKICSGDDCGWLFLDTSKNKSRQWCDMRDCGNRVKVRRFRQKQK